MGRRLRYQVAVSLDGFIAGPNGEHDWIVMDPAIDFAALFGEFDTAVMGRKTYEVLSAQGGQGQLPGIDVVVFSRTLRPATHPGVRIVNAGSATKLTLADQQTLAVSGIVALAYSVPGGVGPAPRIRYVKAPKTRKAAKKQTRPSKRT